MGGHHLILGELTDCITGETLDDTLDERYRQQIGQKLVVEKGFAKTNITPRYELDFNVGEKCARILVTYIIAYDARITMLIHFGPGSLVTRHRPALAMSRLVADYQVPVVVVTNGEEADIINGTEGTVIDTGLERIPDIDALSDMARQHKWETIKPDRKEMESRILMAYEVDDKCPCDDSTCTIG